ncbi:hypothetical protein DEJ33_13680 [Curtobacterium sp. MCPF17_047]|uniref:hypothetical protein n=1 Tax=unclassified Curtobacterium TaxID=257496 RepID=UPI000DA8E83C|nr:MULTISPECIES: hypothetical protein [unclassified Curtobacterium]PZE57248.1 hypothetical protein DEJ24_11755 [Curtobacterium sp. MCPF17_001]PZF63657.1 hypothetical protein DEJ33_13680 [Curtobacterium sp. MCPF17_047]WIB12203.1 hypothetical protein DEJ36_15890 [Curtobacterium sp. MCPF17_052]
MGIDWGAFLLVALVAVVSACFVVSVYSVGLRFWSAADTRAGKYTVKDDGTIGPATAGFPNPNAAASAVRMLRALAVVCFVLCGAAVLYGIYLIVPAFH